MWNSVLHFAKAFEFNFDFFFLAFRCKYQRHSAELPSVSVIVIFHNEHLSTLLRTVYSVWHRTPAKLLVEIVLVDDASSIEDLQDDLTKYIETYMPIVTLVRVHKRSGLIKAREIGAKVARGEVLVFLDAHCEAYHNWLPPLLGLYSKNPIYFPSAKQKIEIKFSINLLRSNGQ